MFTENDIKLVRGGGSTLVCLAEDRTTSSVTATMKPGEPLKSNVGTNSAFVQPLADGDPEVATDIWVGICRKESTETSTVDGEVEVELVQPIRTLLRGKATTAANIDTQSELDALLMDWVSFDVTASSGTNGIFTIDENEGSDPDTHGVCLVGGDIAAGTLDVLVNSRATIAGSVVTS